ncbi:MAG: SDR family oxidoreductase [Clostridiales bacterium]|nr:SDR family oxidoreductase [Clostridiales bacterium]
MKLERRIALITDGFSPIGREIAKLFTDEGAEVFCPCINPASKLEVDAAVSNIFGDRGKIDILVSNCDEIVKASIERCSQELLERCLAINAKSAFLYTQAVGRFMKEARSGKIIYITSIHAEKPTGSAFAYSAAKAAVKMLCKEASLDLGMYGVSVNSVEIGAMEGDDLKLMGEESPFYIDMLKKIPRHAPGLPIEAAKLALFLASDDSSLLNGAELRADAGMTLSYFPRLTYEEYEKMASEPSMDWDF